MKPGGFRGGNKPNLSVAAGGGLSFNECIDKMKKSFELNDPRLFGDVCRDVTKTISISSEAIAFYNCGLNICEQAEYDEGFCVPFLKSVYYLNYSNLFGGPIQVVFMIPQILNFVDSSSFSIKAEALRTLGSVLYSNGSNCVQYHERLFSTLLAHSSSMVSGLKNPDICSMNAMDCLGNLSSKLGESIHQYAQPVSRILADNILYYSSKAKRSDSMEGKCLLSGLRALGYVLCEVCTANDAMLNSGGNSNNNKKRLVGIGSESSWHRVADYLVKAACGHVMASPSMGASWDAAAQQQQQHGDVSIDDISASMTAMGQGGGSTPTSASASRPKTFVLSCIQYLGRIYSKLFQSHVKTLIVGDVRYRGSASECLLETLTHDPSPRLRSAAAAALSSLFEKSKAFWAAADNIENINRAFTPLSRVLGDVICTTHQSLITTILSEQEPMAKLSMIKTLNSVISCAPYSRLKPGHLSSLFNCLFRIINASLPSSSLSATELQILTSCVTCLSTAFSNNINNSNNNAVFSELSTFLTVEEGGHRLSPVIQLLSTIWGSQLSQNLRLEAWNAVGCISQGFCSQLILQWDFIFSQCEERWNQETSSNVQLKIIRLIEKVASHGNIVINDDDGDDQGNETSVVVAIGSGGGGDTSIASPSSPATTTTNNNNNNNNPASMIVLTDDHWNNILKFIGDPLKHQHPTVRASAFATLSAAPCSLLLHQSDKWLNLTLDTIESDEAGIVRCAALKSLGIFLQREELVCKIDLNRCKRVSQTAARDSVANVRMRAIWVIANLAEIEPPISADVQGWVGSIAEICLMGSQDNDKVRCNAIRGLGNVARSKHFAGSAMLSRIVTPMVSTLVSEGHAVKVQWNACTALGRLLSQWEQYSASEQSHLSQVLMVLSDVIVNSTNCKVRIQAAKSLRVPTTRHLFGDNWATIWWKCFRAASSPILLDDPSQYRYTSVMSSELCQTLLHISDFYDESSPDISALTAAKRNDADVFYVDEHSIIAFFRGISQRSPTFPLDNIARIIVSAILKKSDDNDNDEKKNDVNGVVMKIARGVSFDDAIEGAELAFVASP